MADLIQLRVNFGSTTKLILFPKNAGVDDIFGKLTKDCIIGIDPRKIWLYHQGKVLTFGEGSTSKDFNLVHLSELVIFVTVCGGVWPLNALKERKRNLVPLPGFITVTSSPSEPDMITLEGDSGENRAKMPCGHVIGPNSMTSYCQSLLSEGKSKFNCPSVDRQSGKSNCDSEWEYILVRHVACLSEEEMQTFEKKISENYLKKANGLQQCPGCSVWCYQENKIEQNVRCRLCGRSFCWACLKDWIGPRDSGTCGNPGCDGKDSRTRILENCTTKQIYGCPACPSIRSCPKCHMLVEHKDACGHVTCSHCKLGFCMICLKTRSGVEWPCPPSGTCTLAPRQTGSF